MLVYFIVAIFTVQSRVSFVTLGRRGDTIYFDLYSSNRHIYDEHIKEALPPPHVRLSGKHYNIIIFSYYFGILVLDLLFYIAIPGKTSLDEIFLEVVRSPA